MPRVPLYQPSVTRGTPAVAAPQVLRPPEQAFGTDVAAANANLGSAIEKAGQAIGQRVIDRQIREDDKQTLQVATQFQTDLQNKLKDDTPDPQTQVPKGYLSRNGAQAIGGTVAFDADAKKMRDDYLAQVKGPMQQAELARAINAHLLNAREQVITHEQRQSDADLQNTFVLNQKGAVDAAAGLSDPVAVTRAIKAAQGLAGPMYLHLGDKAEAIAAKNLLLNGQMVRSAVNGNLESNPKAAVAILEAHKTVIPASDYAEMLSLIGGKIIHDQQADAWAHVGGHVLSTGEVDLSYAQRYVNALPLPQLRKDEILSGIRTRASIADSEMKKQQEAVKKSYTDQLVTDLHKVPIDVAQARAVVTGLHPAEIADLQNEAIKLYQNPDLKFSTWISKQPAPTVAAVESSKQLIDGLYPSKTFGMVSESKVNVKAAMVTELEQQWLGKTPAQIRQITADATKDIITKKREWGWLHWNDSQTSWNLSAANRANEDLLVGQLEKDNPAGFAQARANLVRKNVPITYNNLKASMGGKK